MIPAGQTGYLRTLDIASNKQFKDNLRMEISEYSWAKITDSDVSDALRRVYLDNKYSYDDIPHNMIQHEMDLQKNNI